MKRWLTLAVLLGLLSTSCTVVQIPGSTGKDSTKFVYVSYETGKVEAEKTPPTVAVTQATGVTCGLFTPAHHEAPPQPPAPTAEELSDAMKLNDRLGDYIDSLRAYIRQRAQEDDQALAEYRKSCKSGDVQSSP